MMPEIYSRFPHEQQALEQIIMPFHDRKDIAFIPNYDLYDQANDHYLECDLIAILPDRIDVIELKHWKGEITIKPHSWIVDHDYPPDPHRSNKYKSQVLKGFYKKGFPNIRGIWVGSTVVLTHPNAVVHNANTAKIEAGKQNLTFADVKTIIKHIEHRLDAKRLSEIPEKLEVKQIQQMAKTLQNHQRDPRRTTWSPLPGYELYEDLTHTAHSIEILAYNERKVLERLRIFSEDWSAPAAIRAEQRQKALNSLKALERVGGHPHIVKTWQIPHEEDLVIEASAWTTEGTLVSLLSQRQHLPAEEASAIILGVLNGLQAIHAVEVLHRDLRPQNILMKQGQPQLMNFDLSYLPEENRVTVFPETILLDASPYRAPELYPPRQNPTPATDLFSVGVIWYELLCGAPPFNSAQELAESGGCLSAAACDTLRAQGVPEVIQSQIAALIRSDPTQRPQTAEQVFTALQHWLVSQQPFEEHISPNRELLPGERHDVYQIETLLKAGGEAQIYRAQQTTERKVALKLFRQEIDRDRVYAEREHLDQVKSPYTLRCETISQWSDKRYFLVFNLIEGDSLQTFIDQQERPNLKTFAHVVHCLFQALADIHQAGLTHNDIKPANLLLTAQGDPVLIDFGAASTPRGAAYQGTLNYRAPDLQHGSEFDFCEDSDLFALGVTLFEWLSGQHPYQGVPSLTAVPRTMSEFRDDIPPALASWFTQAIAPQQQDRFASLAAMRKVFNRIFPLPKPRRRFWTMLIVIGCILGILMGGWGVKKWLSQSTLSVVPAVEQVVFHDAGGAVIPIVTLDDRETLYLEPREAATVTMTGQNLPHKALTFRYAAQQGAITADGLYRAPNTPGGTDMMTLELVEKKNRKVLYQKIIHVKIIDTP